MSEIDIEYHRCAKCQKIMRYRIVERVASSYRVDFSCSCGRIETQLVRDERAYEHDPLCECHGTCDVPPNMSCLPGSMGCCGCGCECSPIRRARAIERELCIAITTQAAGKSPTLGQQRILRALRGES